MKTQSRRQFTKSCLFMTVSGFCPIWLSSSPAGKQNQKSSQLSTQNNKDFLQPKANAKIDPDFKAAYLKLQQSGELKRRGEHLWRIMESCRLCPRECGVNRLKGEAGFCGATSQLKIAAYHPHFGEERPLVGVSGSGTIFFTHCGLRCVFCINWEISQGSRGNTCSLEGFADMMMALQNRGCHNINIVTPTHYSPHILLALDMAAKKGLRLPLVYNTCGWERLDILKVLDGVVDIYLPDFKYWDGEMAARYSSEAETYPEIAKTAMLEMHRQVGIAHPAKDGIMYRGLMIRHLVMPNRIGGTKQVMDWIAGNLPKDTYVNIMSQYRPMHKAFDYPMISRRLKREEYEEAVRWAKEAGLTNLDVQGW